jgi:hypothetical protein
MASEILTKDEVDRLLALMDTPKEIVFEIPQYEKDLLRFSDAFLDAWVDFTRQSMNQECICTYSLCGSSKEERLIPIGFCYEKDVMIVYFRSLEGDHVKHMLKDFDSIRIVNQLDKVQETCRRFRDNAPDDCYTLHDRDHYDSGKNAFIIYFEVSKVSSLPTEMVVLEENGVKQDTRLKNVIINQLYKHERSNERWTEYFVCTYKIV